MSDESAKAEPGLVGSSDSESGASTTPFLRVVRGDASPEEIAALVAVLAASGSPATAPVRRRPAWNDPARGVRPAMAHGPSGWRASSLPR